MKTAKQRVLAALVALVLFGAGLFLGYRLAWECPLPPVPHFGGFGPGPWPGHPPGLEPFPHPTPQQADAFAKELASLQPQLEAFQNGFNALEADFHAQFVALLTAEQRDRMSAHHDEEADWIGEFNETAAARAGQPPTSPPSWARDPRHLLGQVMRIVMPGPTLHTLSERYVLTATQQEALSGLLEKRRQAFLALVKEHPLPYDQLYHTVRQLGMGPPR